jgi:hypothetical protein
VWAVGQSANGLSGIGAGFHLQQKCPGKSYVILEGRDCIGGTWDLFRCPGIRSGSDMFTLGYSFKLWTEPKAIADGPRILDYVRETAAENGIDRNIRYHPGYRRDGSRRLAVRGMSIPQTTEAALWPVFDYERFSELQRRILKHVPRNHGCRQREWKTCKK